LEKLEKLGKLGKVEKKQLISETVPAGSL